MSVGDQRHAGNLVLERYENAPRVGDSAPDSPLYDSETGDLVRLSELAGKRPAVLIFGSLSCSSVNYFCKDLAMLEERFGDRFDFLFVYIREAHPAGGFQPKLEGDLARQELPVIEDPETLEVRLALARRFRERESYRMPFYVDSLEDSAAIQWAAWPARVFVIAPSGKVIYAGGQGPWYFDPVEEGWHTPPPEPIEEALLTRPFSDLSLEEFLDSWKS